MKEQDIENIMINEVIEKFKLFPVDKLKSALKLSNVETEKLQEFINDFSLLASNMSSHNYFLYDIKTIFTAIMICSLKGPKELYDLSQIVSRHMLPKGEDLEISEKILEKLTSVSSIEKIKELVKESFEIKGPEDPELTNVLDENGNKMTISQLEESLKNDKN